MPVQYAARLSPADQIAPLSHTSITLCFPSDDPKKSAAILGKGFRNYCRLLPYMTGTISRSNQRGFTMLSWTDEGTVAWEEKQATGLPSYAELAKKNMPLHELDFDFRPSGIITREYVERPGDRWPALLTCYTIIDGGVICCMSLHHHLVGGTAHAVLVHRLAAVTSGKLENMDAELDGLAPLRRFSQVTQALGIETTESGAIEPISDAPKPALPVVPPAAASKGEPVNLALKIFTIRMAALDALRDTLKEVLKEDLQGRRPPSAAVMASVVWCVINQIRQRRKSTSRVEGKEPSSTLIIPVPANQIFDQGNVVHSRNFVGNLLSAAAASEEVSALAEVGTDPALPGLPAEFADIVKRVSFALGMSMDPTLIKGRLQQIMALPDVRILSSGSTLSSNDLLVSFWGTMSFTGDFGPGLGPPQFVRPTTEPASARRTNRAFYQYAIILPKQKQGGEDVYELYSCFERGDMAEFEQHPLIVRLQRGAARL